MPEITHKPTTADRLDALERDMATLKDALLRQFGWKFEHPEDAVTANANVLQATLDAQTPVIVENSPAELYKSGEGDQAVPEGAQS